jgi:hypothetical protein
MAGEPGRWMMINEPRNWKWMMPFGLALLSGVGGSICIIAWAAAGTSKRADAWMWLSVLAFGLCGICLIATITNWWIYTQTHAANIIAIIQAAQNSTPEVRIFEAARGMHPDAVHDLLAHRRLLWRVKYVAVGELVDWVLDEAPNVHVGFVDFVLDYSSETSVMPKSMLSDKSKQFDPAGVATDYEQYDSLLLLLQQKLMCTRAYGNQPPKWIAPWTPDLLRHRFGLEEGVYQTEGGMLRAIEQAEQWKQAHLPARNAQEATWMDETLKNVARDWDPNDHQSTLASELMSDDELSEAKKTNMERSKE